MIGQRFHKLVVKSRAEATAGNRAKRWNCECDCGNTTVSRSDTLKIGRAKSCGCHRAELGGKRMIELNTTHNMCGTPEYKSWNSMGHRCRNTEDANYGGRGISVCDRWSSFENFFADMGTRGDGLTLERLDVNGNYEPSNCVWADMEAQANNRRNNFNIIHQGITKTLAQWAKHFKIPVWKLHQRLHRDGLSFSDAIINNDRRYKGVA